MGLSIAARWGACTIAAALGLAGPALAQAPGAAPNPAAKPMADMPGMAPARPTAPPPAAQTHDMTSHDMTGHDMTGHDMAGMKMDDMGDMDMPGMAMGGMKGLLGGGSMAREASGTSWQPEIAPPGRGMADMAMTKAGGWMLMGHAQLFAVYDSQGGRRGDDKAFVAGMVMGMASHDLGPGAISFRGMVSPDPLMGKSGYPLLLATGETANGKTGLVDRQHPHDLIAELSVAYSQPIGAKASAFVYVAPVGEPALGPPAFMHRSSGIDDPEAPISHHWLDSTHISYGVVTGGLIVRDVKLELSGFRGREPDQHRFDIETPKLDSIAVRATWNPSPRWSMQASYGHLKSPEQLEPARDENRFTASLAYARPVFKEGAWSSTLAFGRKSITGGGADLNAVLAESELALDRRWTLFTRAEWKEDDELTATPRIFDVGKASLGAIRDFQIGAKTVMGIGVLGSVYEIPGGLKALYGASPISGMLFLRFRAG